MRGKRRLNEQPTTHIRSQAVLTPPTPDPLPALLLLLSALVFHAQASLNPLLTAHLTQPTESSGKSEALLVAGKDAAVLEHVHVHAQVVHQAAHRIVDVGMLVGRDGAFLLAAGNRFVDFAVVHEELGKGSLGGHDELCLQMRLDQPF